MSKMDAHNCLYTLDFVAIPCRGSRMVIVEEVLRKLQGWLNPPDPSTNYTIGLRKLNEETATWLLQGAIFQEWHNWHSTRSLLWLHGNRTCLEY